MSSNAFAAALQLEFKPSRQSCYWRWLTHGAAAATLTLLQSPWLIAAVAGMLMLSLYRSRTQQTITLLWHSDGRWTWYEGGCESEAMLAETPFVQPWLVILPLRVDGLRRIRHVAVFPDMLPAQAFRRLSVRLRGLRNQMVDTGDTQ